jgi:hypothetical protein
MASKHEMFVYLDDLRESGAENMLNAQWQLMRAFDIPPNFAGEVLREWTKIYNTRSKEARP